MVCPVWHPPFSPLTESPSTCRAGKGAADPRDAHSLSASHQFLDPSLVFCARGQLSSARLSIVFQNSSPGNVRSLSWVCYFVFSVQLPPSWTSLFPKWYSYTQMSSLDTTKLTQLAMLLSWLTIWSFECSLGLCHCRCWLPCGFLCKCCGDWHIAPAPSGIWPPNQPFFRLPRLAPH